jgi:putative tricarboxylic transport membrane protein
MKLALHENKNVVCGLMFVGIGALALTLAHNYPMGSALRMGPGYFPNVLGGIMILFGILMMGQGILRPEKLSGPWSLRALAILPLATVIFGTLMEHLGFIPALLILIFLSALAGTEFRFIEVLLLAVGLTVGSWALFIWGLGLPYPLFTGL